MARKSKAAALLNAARAKAKVPPTDASDIRPLVLLAIFLAALSLRILCLVELRDSHLLYTLMGDAELYDLWAREILETRWLGRGVFFQAPFYPYFLAVVYRFFGENLIVVRLIQIIFGAASCVLIAQTGRYFLSKRAGILAGFLLAIYPIAIFYDLLIQKAVFGLFFTAMLLYLLGRTTKAPRGLLWLAAGVTLGCLVMVRENAFILLPVVFIWLIADRRDAGWKRLSTWLALFVCGLALIVLPVGLRNKIVGGEFTLTTSNLGFNLYIGNSGEATGTYRSLVRGKGDWRFESTDATRLAEKAEGRRLSPMEVSQYWTGRALDAIKADFPGWLRLLMKKWALIWNAVEASDTESIYAYRSYSQILNVLVGTLHFGVVLPLALAGICLSWHLRARLWLLYLSLLGYTAGIMPFFVFARYRQTMLAVLAPFAAFALVQTWHHLKARDYRPVAVALVVAIATAVPVNGTIFPRTVVAANTHYNWGSVFEQQGRWDDARRHYALAIQMNPKHALAYNNLGIMASRQGDYRAGVTYFEQALEAEPGMAKTHSNLAIALYHLGRLEEALENFKRALALEPESPAAVHYNMACVLARLNRADQSLEQLRKAIAAGYKNRTQLENDPDLAPLRSRPAFKTLLNALAAES
ncbi:MAG: tetratricopeptide repeat protein [Desulfobacterales bacterium]|jgi:tetratricopeptide (TPR) repeat protein